MKNIIYVFSGRGNSLKTASDLAKRLESCAVVPIRHDTGYRTDPDAERMGIVTSVIDCGLPTYVKRFIDELPKAKKDIYVFAIATNGGMPCATISQFERRLKKRGYRLSSGFLKKFGLGWNVSDEWEKELDDIAGIIRSNGLKRPTESAKDKALTFLANPLAGLIIPSEDQKFLVSSACTGCGICEKVCPAGNIVLEQGRPVFKHACLQCAACFCWCPEEAITGTNLAARTRYKNAGVSLNQILGKQQA